MAQEYTLFEDLTELLDPIKPDSIVSRTFFRDDRMKAILFGFDAGQELSEHTSSQTVILQIVKGEATITVGEDRHELAAGSWLQMPARLKHSVRANTPLTMLLLMFGPE